MPNVTCSGYYNLCFTKGSNYYLTIGVTDSDSTPINLTNYSGIGPIFTNYGGSLIDYFNIEILDPPASGIVEISLTRLQSTGYPVTNGVYQIDFRNDEGEEIKFLKGNIEIWPQLSPTNLT